MARANKRFANSERSMPVSATTREHNDLWQQLAAIPATAPGDSFVGIDPTSGFWLALAISSLLTFEAHSKQVWYTCTSIAMQASAFNKPDRIAAKENIKLKSCKTDGNMVHIGAARTTALECILFAIRYVTPTAEIEGAATLDWDGAKQKWNESITITIIVMVCSMGNHQTSALAIVGCVLFTLQIDRFLQVLGGTVVVFHVVTCAWHKGNECQVSFENKTGCPYIGLCQHVERLVNQLDCFQMATHLETDTRNSFILARDVTKVQKRQWSSRVTSIRIDVLQFPVCVDELGTMCHTMLLQENEGELKTEIGTGDEFPECMVETCIRSSTLPVPCTTRFWTTSQNLRLWCNCLRCWSTVMLSMRLACGCTSLCMFPKTPASPKL